MIEIWKKDPAFMKEYDILEKFIFLNELLKARERAGLTALNRRNDMSTQFEQCEQQVKNLSMEERGQLIQSLIEGLDDIDEQRLEALWIQEASKRLDAYKSGRMDSRPSQEVFSNARAKLKEI